jgi:hypothetical protein
MAAFKEAGDGVTTEVAVTAGISDIVVDSMIGNVSMSDMLTEGW